MPDRVQHPNSIANLKPGKSPGRPKLDKVRVNIRLPKDLDDRVREIATQQNWELTYAYEQLCRAMLNLNPDYDENDFAQIRSEYSKTS